LRTNFVLIDYENVQPDGIELLKLEPFKVYVFVGDKQARVSFEAAAALQQLGDRAKYVKISGNGRNALDFHIAFYIGRLSQEEPESFFHIISKDTGFDPLFGHLKSLGIFAGRCAGVTDIPLVKTLSCKTLPDRVEAVLANLKLRGTARPRLVSTLESTIHSLFQKSLSDVDLQAVIKALRARKYITVNGDKVTYALPE
jgi:hypothetical protein